MALCTSTYKKSSFDLSSLTVKDTIVKPTKDVTLCTYVLSNVPFIDDEGNWHYMKMVKMTPDALQNFCILRSIANTGGHLYS